MKFTFIFLFVLLFSIVGYSQIEQEVVPSLQSQVTTLQNRVNELASQVNAIINRINALPPTQAQSRNQATAYREVCVKSGLRFGGIEVNSRTNDIIIRCN